MILATFAWFTIAAEHEQHSRSEEAPRPTKGEQKQQHWLQTGVDMMTGKYLWNFFKHTPSVAVRAKGS